ncbi:MAG: hypothetical protein KBF42_09085, partial [Chitinophagales bacterium]|nr:hypothetical protein [Chitinophagales bacterium]
QSMEIWEPNLFSFDPRTPNITQELLELSDSSSYSHPEFGILPENTPCYDCVELIEKRTPDSRYFVRSGTNGNTFYEQTAFDAIHYLDEEGRLVSFDRRLQEDSTNLYIAKHQATPTLIDLNNKQTGFIVNGERFGFNNALKLKHILPGGDTTILGSADWSNNTIGDHGIYVKDIWPEIDMQITFDLNMIKTNFIIKSPLGITNGYLAITDQLILPENFAVGFGTGWNGEKGWVGTINSASTEAELYGFEIGRAIAYDTKYLTLTDRDSIGIHEYSPEYLYDSISNKLTILISGNWLNEPTLVYPLTIDPIVTSSAMYGAVIKFRINGEWCGGATYCSYTLDVPLPANSTVTAATFSSQFITVAGTCLGSCWVEDAGFRMWSDSCDVFSPPAPFFWACSPAPGTGACTAVNFDLFSLFSCLTPKCSGSIPIEMRTSYCYCNTNGTCPAGAPVPCQRMNANSWSITLTGHNLETLGDVADGNGAVTYNDAFCCDDFILDPNPQYGVPPYTYLWTGGGTAADTTVFSCTNGIYVYTCQVTDACNITRTATFTLIADNCLLPVTLTSFEGEFKNGIVILEWSTESEINTDYFVVERNTDGEYISIETKQAKGQSQNETNYSVIDEIPIPGIDYYRLRQVDNDGAISYSDAISVEVSQIFDDPFPNPTSGSILFTMKNLLSGDGVYVTITNSMGHVVFAEQMIYSGSGYLSLPVENLADGSYTATLIFPGKDPVHYPFIKQ